MRFVVPYPPGGGTDVIARIVQDRSARCARPADHHRQPRRRGRLDRHRSRREVGARRLHGAVHAVFAHHQPGDLSEADVRHREGLRAGRHVCSLPQILVANPQFPANTVEELVAMAKAKPGALSYASVGNGSPGHLAGEMLKLRTGTQMTHIPYRGGGPAVIDVIGGQVPLLWVSIPAAAQFVKQKQLKALAVSTRQAQRRVPRRADDAGSRHLRLRGRLLVRDVRAGEDAASRSSRSLNAALNTVLKEPEIREKLLAQGSEGVGGTPEQLGAVRSRRSCPSGRSWSRTPASRRIACAESFASRSCKCGARSSARSIARARAAQAVADGYDQARVDELVAAAGWAIMEPARNRELAELAVADTGIGNVDDKIRKNHRKTLGLLRDLQGARSVGVIAEDPARGLVEIARPVGVVSAITPSTNPAATPANKIINALKGRNAVIVAPSPKGWTHLRAADRVHPRSSSTASARRATWCRCCRRR